MSVRKDITLEADIECSSCDATGIYKGFAEGGYAGVVCQSCNGTGMVHVIHKYTSFKSRRTRGDVKRVYETAAGFSITDTDIYMEDGKAIEFSKAGVDYKDWLDGEKPLPIYDLHCPLCHYDQGSLEGEYMKEYRCKEFLRLGQYITQCACKNKAECWKWFKDNDVLKKANKK